MSCWMSSVCGRSWKLLARVGLVSGFVMVELSGGLDLCEFWCWWVEVVC